MKAKPKCPTSLLVVLTLAVLSLPHIIRSPGINPWWVNIREISATVIGTLLVILLHKLKLLWDYLLYDKEDTRKDKIGVILVLLLVIIGAVSLVRELASTESGAYFIQHILTPKD